MFSRSNVNEEYMQAFRTKSYLDMWSKAQSQIERREEECHSSSPFPPCFHLSDFLLEPQQETLLAMINDSQPHTLVLDYFNGSLEACRICDFLLQGFLQLSKIQNIQVVAPPCSSRGGLSSSQKKGISTVHIGLGEH
eukprot:TRINITY_DN25012_c0_g1_i4.p1 TRINITY_DN25012_c0_g1~~TRINITY_DN25012_c0_g1_i4.p1  ORF type:complete len:137 (-),score=31.06 TRINITY_DN25012_c0_g1_i4:98-508(-)